jgi:hypothetical protein
MRGWKDQAFIFQLIEWWKRNLEVGVPTISATEGKEDRYVVKKNLGGCVHMLLRNVYPLNSCGQFV